VELPSSAETQSDKAERRPTRCPEASARERERGVVVVAVAVAVVVETS